MRWAGQSGRCSADDGPPRRFAPRYAVATKPPTRGTESADTPLGGRRLFFRAAGGPIFLHTSDARLCRSRWTNCRMPVLVVLQALSGHASGGRTGPDSRSENPHRSDVLGLCADERTEQLEVLDCILNNCVSVQVTYCLPVVIVFDVLLFFLPVLLDVQDITFALRFKNIVFQHVCSLGMWRNHLKSESVRFIFCIASPSDSNADLSYDHSWSAILWCSVCLSLSFVTFFVKKYFFSAYQL